MTTHRTAQFLLVSLIALGGAGCLPHVDPYHSAPIEGSRTGVFLETGFEEHDWYTKWGMDKEMKNMDIVDAPDGHGFKPLHGKALRITIKKDSLLGVDDFVFHFAKARDEQPEEIYLKYSLRYGDDFQTVDGGKMPGFGGTYDTAGWGGRTPHGDDGWSARGGFDRPDADGNIGYSFYVYHLDQPHASHGERMHWDQFGNRGLLKPNQWYTIEEYIKLNTPGKKNGVLRGWVDGKLAFEREDLRFRTTRNVRIEDVWMNVFHGGDKKAVKDHHLYFDDVVISEKRVK